MESVEAPLALKINHVVYTKVEGVYEKDGKWWVQFEGSRESIGFAGSKPYEQNDKVKITFERVTDAKPV